MSEDEGLPAGWLQVKLGDILRIRNGFAFKSSDFQTAGVPLIRQSNIGDGYVDISDAKRLPPYFLNDHAEFVVRKGDYLIGMSGSLGKLGEFKDDEPALQNQRTGLLVAEPQIQSGFVRYALKFVEPQIVAEGKGVAVQNVSAQEIEDCRLPLPPLNEQTRIVAKLEELLSDLDAGVAELRAAQKKLTRYRQSLLKAAVEGALTAEWRKHNKPKETGAQLLERILEKRRVRWEEKQLAKFKEQGKAPLKGWQGKYVHPVTPDITNLSELPQGWVWSSLDQLLETLTSGSRDWAPYYDRGACVFVMAQNVRPWRPDFSFRQFVDPPEDDRDRGRSVIAKDDLLVTIVGANTGQSCRVHEDLKDHFVCQSVALLRLVDASLSEYVNAVLNSEGHGQRLFREMNYGAGRPHLSFDQIESVQVPLPPPSEQEEIVRRIGLALASTRDVALQASEIESYIAGQRKNILEAAFSGQLVSQDPHDEPASILLERIRAERLVKAGSTTKRLLMKRA